MEESTVQTFFTEVFVWGLNKDKQCTTDDEEYIQLPLKLTVGLVVRSVACGEAHTILSTNEGLLYGIGCNKNGQLGIGRTKQPCFAVPQQILKLTNIDLVVSGANHALALTDEGIIYGWGDNQYGQLGTDEGLEIQFEPSVIKPQHKFQNVLAGASFSVFVCDNDEILVCGQNVLGLPDIDRLDYFVVDLGEVSLNFLCTGFDCVLLSSLTNLYLVQSELQELPLYNIQQLYSGYHPMIMGEDDEIFEYIHTISKISQLTIPDNPKISDCTRGKDLALVVDEVNNVYTIQGFQCQMIEELRNQEVRIVVAGYHHFVALGQITKQNTGFKLILSPTKKQEQQDFPFSPVVEEKQKAVSNNSSIIQAPPENMLFSFSLRKDINALNHHWSRKKSASKQNLFLNQSDRRFNLSQALLEDKATQTESADLVKHLSGQVRQLEAEVLTLREEQRSFKDFQDENANLKKQRQQQKKNLELQLQYQETLQEQVQRLIKENETLKAANIVREAKPSKQELIDLLHQKEVKIRSMINGFYSDHYRIMSQLKSQGI